MPDGITINPAISSAGQATASTGSAAAAAASPLMRERWADSAGTWSIRKVLGDVGDRLTGSSAGRVAPSNYQQHFGIGMPDGIRQVGLSNLNWQGYSDAVKQNFRNAHIRPNVSLGEYAKGTLWRGNVQDTANLFSRNPDISKQWGTGLAKAGGLAFMAFDAFKGSKETHDAWAAQEDGSFGSKARTWTETAKTFGKKALKNGVAWEAASLGFAVGTAALPFTGPLGIIGGIAVGALAGAGVKTVMDKILPDRDVPPGGNVEANDETPATLTSTVATAAINNNPFASSS